MLSALLHGPVILAVLLGLAIGNHGPGPAWIGLAVSGYIVHAVAALVAPGPRGIHRLGLALTLPLYWPLQSLAALRALYGMVHAPHFWAKTPHGLTRRAPGPDQTGQCNSQPLDIGRSHA